jgi:cytochrome P450
MNPPPDVDYDPFSGAVLRDPFPAYEALRQRCPVHHLEQFTPPFFTLTRYDDVRRGLTDPGTWSIRHGQSPQYTRPSGLVNDPPEHTAFRLLFSRAFTPRMVSRLEADITTLATDLLDGMASRAAGDFFELFASPLPTTVIARLLGIPSADLGRFRQMSDELTATYNAPDPAASAGPRAAFDDNFRGLVNERRAALQNADVIDPGPQHLGTILSDDLISGLVVAEVEGRRLTDHELQWMLLLLLLGGNETSTALLTNLVWRLLEAPSRWDAVVADPALVDIAVEESLRHDPPVLGLFRTPTRDVRLHGVDIPAKAKVMLCFASANRDDVAFDDPATFSLDRDLDDLKRHLSFGFGAHYCPGAALARIEARISLRMLIARFPNLRLDGEPSRIVPFNLWGRRTLPLAWSG